MKITGCWRVAAAAFALSFVIIPRAGGTELDKREVPAAVLDAFAKRFPKATVKKYLKEDRDGKVVFEIESINADFKTDVIVSADGVLLETEEAIPLKRVPKAAMKAAKAKHPIAKVEAAEKITRGAQVLYEVIFLENGKKVDVVLDHQGHEPVSRAPSK
ncbi:MAG: PepSY-like domain-containing protein [Proteobacteria bacterium]|nr:PepSY-like domain-containing protein [Pseudomonadota bacterium]